MDMSDPVNAEVVEMDDGKRFPEYFIAQYIQNRMVYADVLLSSELLGWKQQRGSKADRYRIARIPAEGEEQPKREPATLDEVEQYASRGCGPTLYHYEKAWRAAERHHGIGEPHGRP